MSVKGNGPFEENGVIGASGVFYGCEFGSHISTMIEHHYDWPFVECKCGEYLVFEEYYTSARKTPNAKQFETAIDWCAWIGVTFEKATDAWADPWRNFK